MKSSVTGLVADADAHGHFNALMAICQGPGWGELWAELAVSAYQFGHLGLPRTAPDAEVWAACQSRGLILLTGNRNQHDASSLEATIRARGTADSLPVFTLADRERVLRDVTTPN